MLMNAPNKLRELREAQDLTLEELAEEAGISPGYISKLESGDRDLNMRTMRKLAKPLQATLRDMMPSSEISIDAELKLLPRETSQELVETFLRTIRLARKLGKATD